MEPRIRHTPKGFMFVVLAAVLSLAAGVLPLTLHAQNNTTANDQFAITVGAYAGDVSALLYIAREKGYFADQGLDVELKEYPSGKQAADDMLAGKSDVFAAGEFVFITNVHGGNPDLRIFGTISKFRIDQLLARTDMGVAVPGDLRGRKIAVLKKATSEFFLGRTLEMNGMALRDVQLVDLTPPEIVRAVLRGDVHAGQTWDPNVYEIKRALGDAAMIVDPVIPPEETFVLVTRNSWLEANPQAARRFLRALITAEEFAARHPDQTKDLLAGWFGLEANYLNYLYPRIDLEVRLSQRLLLVMEDETRWAVDEKIIGAKEGLNYLDFIHTGALRDVDPAKLTIIE